MPEAIDAGLLAPEYFAPDTALVPLKLLSLSNSSLSLNSFLLKLFHDILSLMQFVFVWF